MVLDLVARLRALSLFVCLGCADRGAVYPRAPAVHPISSLPARYGTCAVDPEGCNDGIQRLSQQESGGDGQTLLLTGPLAGAPPVSKSSGGLRRMSKGIGRV